MATSSTTGQPGRIDLHHHFFPLAPGIDTATAEAELLRQTVWIMPPGSIPWTPRAGLAAMDRLGIEKAVLSVPQGGDVSDRASRRSARALNESAHRVVQEHPARFAFFAHVPVPLDPAAAIDELAYAVDELGAVGVTLVSSYGRGDTAHYLGSDVFDPLWEELHRRGTVVFVHGDQTPGSNRWPNPFLPLPVTEVPNETFKAAADLVTRGKKNAFSGARVILSHSGGSTPFLASRVAGLSSYLGTPLDAEELLESFRSFYYETALSGFETNLLALESFVPDDHILFGTDFPAIPVDTAEWYTGNVARHFGAPSPRHDAIVRGNALRLFPGLL
jgi:predicted TIM-barrel fold metal-dependent hydrolase